MNDLHMLVWLTQLGLSVVLPPAVLIWLSVWLRNCFGWGQWVIWFGIGLGMYFGISGFVATLRTISQLTKDKKQESHPISFNEHD